MARTLAGIDGVKAAVGEHLGWSGWRDVDQATVNLFADATGDHQWIHVDPERAKAESPFGAPIAHGYWTLSLAPTLLDEIVRIEGKAMGLNYGIDRLRFPAPLPVGSRVRMGVRLAACTDVPNGVQLTWEATFEAEGSDKPVCVAELLYRELFG